MPEETPKKDYRENPQRAVYLLGELNQQLVEKLTPRITQLRQEPPDPITAYIDSQGGDVSTAENLRGLLQAPN
jgi:ATP-dependent protease ClpP protease subunit